MILKSMKRTVLTVAVVALICGGITSCGSKKSVTDATKSKEVELPFSGKEYRSDDKFFRAKNVGESPNLATSKKIAMTNAKAELASAIQTTVKNVTDQYVNQTQVSDRQMFESKFEEMTRTVVNQQLNDVRVIDEKTFQTKDGKYSHWVAIEMAKDALLNSIANQITKDEKLQVDFDKFQFEKIFNEEMEKFQNQ